MDIDLKLDLSSDTQISHEHKSAASNGKLSSNLTK